MTKREAMDLTRQQARLLSLGISRDDADALRRISMTLRRWFELECGDSNDYASWCLVRGHKSPRTHQRDPETQQSIWVGGEFTHDENGSAWMERHAHSENKATYTKVADRETGARKRLAAIMAKYLTLTAYVQGDPRGCSLYILSAADVAGLDVNSVYNRGVAVA